MDTSREGEQNGGAPLALFRNSSPRLDPQLQQWFLLQDPLLRLVATLFCCVMALFTGEGKYSTRCHLLLPSDCARSRRGHLNLQSTEQGKTGGCSLISSPGGPNQHEGRQLFSLFSGSMQRGIPPGPAIQGNRGGARRSLSLPLLGDINNEEGLHRSLLTLDLTISDLQSNRRQHEKMAAQSFPAWH